MVLDARLYGRFKHETDDDWKLIAAAQEQRTLECAIENDNVMGAMDLSVLHANTILV